MRPVPPENTHPRAATKLHTAVVIVAALAAPLLACLLGCPADENGRQFSLMGQAAFFWVSAIAVLAALHVKARGTRDEKGILTLLFPYAVFAVLAYLSANVFWKSGWDYRAYESAAHAILAKGDPYTAASKYPYLYPPTLAFILAGWHEALRALLGSLGFNGAEGMVRALVFYSYKASHLLAAAGACTLLSRKGSGGETDYPPFAVASLFLFNVPLLFETQFSQVNMFIVFAVVLAVHLWERRPCSAGCSLAFAVCLKPFAALVLIPFLARKPWRIAAGFIAALAVFLVVPDLVYHHIAGSDFVFPMYIRAQVLLLAQSWPVMPLHDGSVRTLVELAFQAVGTSLPLLSRISAALWALACATAAVCFVSRGGRMLSTRRTAVYQALAVAAVTPPLVWEHHYLLALPLAAVAFPRTSSRSLAVFALASGAVFLTPVTHMFPVPFIRLAGLLALLYLSFPRQEMEGDIRGDTGSRAAYSP